MQTREYRFKFYLNASHYININTLSKAHPHTWELVLHIRKTEAGFTRFTEMEDCLKRLLAPYEGKFLNEVEPFTNIEPTLENIGEVFYSSVQSLAEEIGWKLSKLEISENPTRTFIIHDAFAEGHGGACEEPNSSEAGFSESFHEVAAGSESTADSCYISEPGSSPQEEGIHSEKAIQDRYDPLSDNEGTRTGKESIREYADRLALEFIKNRSAKKAPQKAPKVGQIAGGSLEEKASARIVLLGYLFIAAVLGAVLYRITRTGLYPWGSDSWYHLFKADLLYTEIKKGNLFPLYTSVWYNGIQPLRYWAPLPHYVLALFQFASGGSIAVAYNAFIGFVFVLGASGWMLWGRKTGRFGLGLALAVLWFFMPDNIRVLFSEGNISRVMVTAVFPFLLLAVWLYLEKRSRPALLGISLSMLVVTLCHAMIAAMVGICLFLFVSFYCIILKKTREFFESMTAAVLGLSAAGVWLIPALKGGLVSMDSGAVGELMRSLTYPFMESLDPFIRFTYADNFYFGLPALVVAILGIWLGDKKSKAGFIVTLIIFMGTARELVGILQKIPMSQLFWMMRFTPLAMGTLFVGLMLWKRLKTKVLLLMIALLAVDGMLSFQILGHNAGMPPKVREILDKGIEITSSRIALFDGSRLGSFPSFYLSQEKNGKRVEQVFGSGWQGAKTASNVMWLNTALEKGWYEFLLDRSLEHGADTIIVKHDKAGDMARFTQTAKAFGYEKVYENELGSLYKLPVNGCFGTTAAYKGLAVGKYASNLSFIFPTVQIAEDPYLDHYKPEELQKYQMVFLSGFKYENKERAEELVRELSQKGVRFVIDLTGAERDVFSSSPDFLGVSAQPAEFQDRFPALQHGDSSIELTAFPYGLSRWNTFYLGNLDEVQASIEFNNQMMDVMGSKHNRNICFLGLNLPYYAIQTRDGEAIKVLEEATGLKAFEAPAREIVRLKAVHEANGIKIDADKENAVTGVAALDSFIPVNGGYTAIHNLVRMQGTHLELKAGYPCLTEGLAATLAGLAGILLLQHGLKKRRA